MESRNQPTDESRAGNGASLAVAHLREREGEKNEKFEQKIPFAFIQAAHERSRRRGSEASEAWMKLNETIKRKISLFQMIKNRKK